MTNVTSAHRRSAKLLQVAQHRVLRWFRRPEAAIRRHRAAAEPTPMLVPPGLCCIPQASLREEGRP